MIKILVLTEDFDAWIQKITSELISYSCRKYRTSNKCQIQSDLFFFEIRSHYSENSRGECWSCAILDKYIPHELEFFVLRPCVKQGVICTKNYKIVGNCMGTLQTPSSVTCKEDIEHLIDD